MYSQRHFPVLYRGGCQERLPASQLARRHRSPCATSPTDNGPTDIGAYTPARALSTPGSGRAQTRKMTWRRCSGGAHERRYY
jgi:hypothetical protein